MEQSFDIFTSKYRVMTQLFMHPGMEFTLTEISGGTGLSKATVSRIVQKLRTTGFVSVQDLGVIYRIKANADSPIYKREKVVYNLHMLVRNNITEFLTQKFSTPRCIVLFGSYRKGEDGDGSDIDIAVEVPEGAKTGTAEKIRNRPCQLYSFGRGTAICFSRIQGPSILGWHGSGLEGPCGFYVIQ